jgi:hypothetical protein
MLRKRTYFILVAGLVSLTARANAQKSFATPEEARDALIQAAKNGLDAVKTLFGPESNDILRTGDPVEDKNVVNRFNTRAAEKTRLDRDEMNPHVMRLLVGKEEFPFAIPLIEKGGRWSFDLQAGKAEIRNRVIGGNELDVIDICRSYVDAQELYAETDWNGNGVPEYARKIFSSEGKKDGLYWPGDDSPVAANFAKAIAAGYQAPTGTPRPFHGYYFKILLAQGPDAEGGEQDYIVHDMMIGGFALVAWPAEYRVSGIKTFIVNQDDVVYEKDLGPQTSSLAKAMDKFNPDDSWEESPEDDTEN